MKLRLLTAGLLTCLSLGLFQGEASAESNWASKCDRVQPNENPTFQQMNCLLTNAAIDADIPPEVVKAVATQENNGWKQFDDNGKPIITADGGIGLMQITNKENYDLEILKYDISYNIEAGIEILNSMYTRGDLPKIKGVGRDVIENWYFPVMAYNGTKPVNSPLYQLTGEKNKNAYQEQVFGRIEQDSFLNFDFSKKPILGQYPFKTTDFDYSTTSSNNINFLKKEYTLTNQMHTSTHLFKKGENVFVTTDKVKLRKLNNTKSEVIKELNKNTILTINGPFEYDNKNNNQFVWYPVTIEGSKIKGYISSAYITKAATVHAVDNNDTSVSGIAPAKSTILIMNGKTRIGSITANTSGIFNAKMNKPQKAGTKLTITFKDPLNTPIPLVTVTVIDKTAPKPPVINPIKKTSKVVTGKTEAYALVHLKVGGKTLPGKKADKYGIFKISIKPLKAGTYVTATAIDAAKNTSKTSKRVIVK